MPAAYTSIFDGPTLITRRDLCELLNLDTSRPGLLFSDAEIRKAYRLRAIMFHPDKHNIRGQTISKEICEILMNDIVLARDYMLDGADNIPGKAFLDKGRNFQPEDWVAAVIGTLNALKTGTSTLSFGVTWLSRLSNSYLMVGLMSTFSDGQLNFHYLNYFSKTLAAVKPYLQNIDGSLLAEFLHKLKDTLKTTEQLDAESIFKALKSILPKSMTEHPDFDTLLLAIKETGVELKNVLTDDFIDHLQHIIQFWPHFIATVPSWKHIMGVYFTALIFTSNNILKFFNALKVIAEVILEQKGGIVLALAALPLLLLTAVVLPVNIMFQLGLQFTWIALKASLQLLINGLRLLSAMVHLFNSFFYESDKSSFHEAFTVFENVFNLTVRLSINILFEALDATFSYITGENLLTPFIELINTTIDTMLSIWRLEIDPPGDELFEELALAHEKNGKEKPAQTQGQEQQSFSFFANSSLPLHNLKDLWLDKLLASLVEEEQVNDNAQQACAI